MAAKKNADTTATSRETSFAVHLDPEEIEASALTAQVEVPPAEPPAQPASGGEADARPKTPKSGPAVRGADRFGGVGRGRGPAPGRRYAFRRS